MNPPRPANPSEQVREQILDAAQQRFEVFGLGKTTMAEIAEDTGMSAANLYRYFENKQDIAGACACRCMNEGLDLLRATLRDSPARCAASTTRPTSL